MSDAREESRPNKGGGGLRRLIVLAAMVVGVAALVVLLTVVRNREPQIPEADPTPGKPEISRIDIERIAAVSLTGPGREQPFTMQRTESGWRIEGAAREIPIKESRIKDILYSFGSLYAERVIEDDAADLKQYGLDPPAVVAVATLDDGSSIEVHLGDRTPAGNTWYLGLPGQRIVYAVWTNHGNHYYYTVADMRGDELPAINGEALNYLRLQGPAIATLEIVETNPLDTRFADLLTRLAVIQPYAFPRAIDSEEFANVLAALAAPRIDRIVSDDREAAADYGLAPPRFEVLARDAAGAEVALLFGDERDGDIFFQVAGRTTVYAMKRSRAGVIDLQPFALVDKFVLILNIEKVDAIEIVHPGGTNLLSIERTGSGDDLVESFAIDGAAMEDKPFRELYQLVIGLLGDAELPPAEQSAVLAAQPEVRITYRMNTPGGDQSVALVPYDRQFYAAVREGAAEFMVARAQVARLLDGLAAHAAAAPTS
jgi:hypothetical protein